MDNLKDVITLLDKNWTKQEIFKAMNICSCLTKTMPQGPVSFMSETAIDSWKSECKCLTCGGK